MNQGSSVNIRSMAPVLVGSGLESIGEFKLHRVGGKICILAEFGDQVGLTGRHFVPCGKASVEAHARGGRAEPFSEIGSAEHCFDFLTIDLGAALCCDATDIVQCINFSILTTASFSLGDIKLHLLVGIFRHVRRQNRRIR